MYSMNSKTNILLFVIGLLCLFGKIQAQSDLQIGEWESHLSHFYSSWLTQSKDYIYVSSGKDLMKIEKASIDNGEVSNATFISKVEGLSESNIDKMLYDNFNNQLIVIYESSNIDILTSDEIINIPFIKDNTNIVGSRAVNDLIVVDETNCLIACAFGVINLDLKKLEFKYTTFTPSGVKSVTSDEVNYYIGLDDGMYSIPVNDANPIDFSRWNFQGSEVSLPTIYDASHVDYFNNKVYVVGDDIMYAGDPTDGFEVVDINKPSGFNIEWMSSEGPNLIIGLTNKGNNKAEVRRIDKNGTIVEGGAGCINQSLYGIELEDNSIWYADNYRNIRYTEGVNYGCRRINFNSPRSNDCSQIEVKKDQVFFASGGASDNFNLLSNREGIYILEDNNWTNVNAKSNPEIDEYFFLNFVSVAPFPKENKVAMASFYSGLATYDLDTKEMEFFDAENSTLQGLSVGDKQARVAYCAFDKDENLWMSNFASPDPIVLRTKEGDWLNFKATGASGNLTKMVVDDNGYIWFLTTGISGGVLVYDPGDKVVDRNDDRYRFFNTSNSELPAPQVYSIGKDLDGDVWVGTSQGPVAFECDVFDDQCKGSRRKVLQDSIAAFLLDTEEILAIEVDGANRKWFGTKNGIFVQSPDGEEQIAHYTEENTPLFSNTINDLDFDGKTGRMYISTNNGIQSLKTETLEARTTHSGTVYAYPNPVRPDYDGPIAIKGLGRDANVKITDLNGRLVYETQALGGQAIWNGRDYNGSKAASGVYLVFSSSKVSFDRSDDYVTKILIID